MASLRPINGGSSGTILFEDFHPTSDRLEEEGAEILALYLPDGFDKEHIKITYVDSTRIIRVQGQKSIGNNVWGRFNETFPVPKNCVVNKISGQLREGVLTITMPKQIMTPMIISPKVDVRPPEPLKEPKPTDPPKTGSDPVRPSKDQQEPKPTEPPKTGSHPVRPSKDQQEPKSTEVPKTGSHPTRPSKDQQEPKPVVPSLPPKPAAPETKLKPVITPKEDGKKVVSSQTSHEDKQKQEIEETPKVRSYTTTTMQAKEDDKTVLSEPRKITAGSSKKRKELVISDAALEKKERREDKVKEDKDSLLEKVKEMQNVSKRSGKELAFQLTEERQALLNAGVAVLVVVALGAYITYSIKSSGNTKN